MEEAMRRKLYPGEDRSEEPEEQSAGLHNLADQIADGYAGVRALEAGALKAPADLEWEEAEDDWSVEPNVVESEGENDRTKLLLSALGVFLLALIPRLIFLFVVTDPGVVIPTWSNDTFHHWQIAYLSKEIGFQQGFLRLWDLKGMEYFWGLLHPLLLAGAFQITGSVDIMIPRLLSMIAGSLNIVFLYLLGVKYWNERVGLAIALLTALNPIVIFNDPSGMVEPLGFVFILAGIYFYPNRSFLAGLLFALGAMARAEGWLFSLGLIFAALILKGRTNRKLPLVLGWAIPMLVYMRYLFVWTGNPIYPVYWNFLANAAGKWVYRDTYTAYQLAAKPVLVSAFILAVIAALWVLWRKPKGYLLHLLGLGTTAFITGFIGLTAYLTGYETWFWLTRFFAFSYTYLGVLLAVFFLEWFPRRLNAYHGGKLAWVGVGATLLAIQLTWPPVLYDVRSGYTNQPSKSILSEYGRIVNEAHEGGVVLIPEDNPQVTYAVVRYGGITADKLLGQMYSPLYYFEGDPFANWDVVGPQMWQWLEAEDVSVLVTYPNDTRFQQLIDKRPQIFTYVATLPESPMDVYKVGRQ